MVTGYNFDITSTKRTEYVKDFFTMATTVTKIISSEPKTVTTIVSKLVRNVQHAFL